MSSRFLLRQEAAVILLTKAHCYATHCVSSKCGKNNKVAHEAIAECVTDVLTTFSSSLWYITEQTQGNKESICFI